MKTLSRFQRPVRNAQRGAALFVALIMLLVLTLIGVAVVRSSGTQIAASANTQLAAEALTGAENSALTAERRILTAYNGVPTFDFDVVGNDGLYNVGGVNVTTTNWNAINHEVEGDSRYVVEYLGPAPAPAGSLVVGAGGVSEKRYLFRTTGRGASSKGSVRVVQTIVATAE
ncbi:MAG: pilus assembly PilX family protein [Gammaproteobacteria bacterium]